MTLAPALPAVLFTTAAWNPDLLTDQQLDMDVVHSWSLILPVTAAHTPDSANVSHMWKVAQTFMSPHSRSLQGDPPCQVTTEPLCLGPFALSLA